MRRGSTLKTCCWVGVTVLVALTSDSEVMAATRRALLVGINDYVTSAQPGTPAPDQTTKAIRVPPKPSEKGRGAWTNLDGAVNDVDSMSEILAQYFGFDRKNIVILRNSDASRDRILREFRRVLVDPVAPGDICFFFYAGHGSQVANSRSAEPDRLDETFVPADSAIGARDLRDKELRSLFNDVIDRKGLLTVVADSCHSGSIGRGLRTGKVRWIEPDMRDVASDAGTEKPDPRPEPFSRPGGAVILSAAQDYQTAKETVDENGLPHGSFSLALQRTLSSTPRLSTVDLFKRAKALLQADGSAQEPVLQGPNDRLHGAFLGDSLAPSAGVLIAVVRLLEPGLVELQGGRAIGLAPRAELLRPPATPNGTALRLVVTETPGLVSAVARVAEGDATSVRVGDLFTLAKWVAPDEASVRVWLPPPLEDARAVATAEKLAQLRTSGEIAWIDDPVVTRPTHVIQWNGTHWEIEGPDGSTTAVGTSPSVRDVLAGISRPAGSPARVFLDLPPPPALVDGLGLRTDDPTSAVQRVAERRRTHYVLCGRRSSSGLEYAWILHAATLVDRDSDGHEIPVDPGPLPPTTDWVAYKPTERAPPSAASQLAGLAQRLGVVRGWIELPSPADDGSFPYRLALRPLDAAGNASAPKSEGDLFVGDHYQLVLLASPTDLERGVEHRYVYVFTIDRNGRSQLLLPLAGQGNVENRMPLIDGESPSAMIPVGRPFRIAPPAGVDTYFLLTSREALPDPDVLAFGGVRTRVGLDRGGVLADGQDAALTQLLLRTSSKVRGAAPQVPVDWSLQRLTFRSMARP